MIFKNSLQKLLNGLAKTKNAFTRQLKELFTFGRKIDNELLDKLEEILISADVGVETASSLIEDIKKAYEAKTITDTSQLLDYLKNSLKKKLAFDTPNMLNTAPSAPTVILVVGVNGTGKTTSIAKIANYLLEQDKKVMLAASDTFRAAAIEQLAIWGQRLNINIIAHKSGADPAAVAFDAADSALAKKMDYLIVDTAGRLHTKVNLMKELSKISDVLGKKIPGAPHEVLIVLDATTGQNAIAQAKTFKEASKITGIVLSKLDGTAKGGIVIAIKKCLDVPVKFIGVGEKMEDLEVFDPDKFIDALFTTD